MGKKIKPKILIEKQEVLDLYNHIYNDLDVKERKDKLLITSGDRVVSIIYLNDYDSIINLKIQSRYGYLNQVILNNLIGLIYKREGNNV